MSASSSWPLVGRTEELEVVASTVAAAEQGLVIAGDAGVGKTRLAREAVAAARDRGTAVSWTVATQAEASIPFGVFGAHLPARAAKASRLDLFRAVVDGLRDLASAGPLVLGVDDAHLLDDASAAVVHQLAVAGDACVLATVRTGETTPAPVTSLWKEELAHRLKLQPLAEAEVADLVGQVVGGTRRGRVGAVPVASQPG